MLTKVYGIDGVVEASYLFVSGKTKLRAQFKDGIVDAGRERPATLITRDPVVQLIIEHQPLFVNGNIRIVSTTVEQLSDTEPDKKSRKKVDKSTDREAVNSVSIEDDGTKVYDKVTNIGQAVNVLMDLGAKADQLTSPTDALATAAKLNVTFPNLKLK